MIYKLLTKNKDGIQIIACIDDDGLCRLTCTENDQAYLQWLSEGNTTDPADPIPEPVELTPQEKLVSAGLSVDELKVLLGIAV